MRGMTSSGHGSEGTSQVPDFRLVIDSAPALIHTGMPDGYLDFFNQTWLRYVGRSLEDLQGWKWTASIHPDDVEGIVERWRASLGSGEPFLYEARVQRADGEYRWMLHHKIALRDEDGEIVKWFGSSIDIEDRKRAEGSLQRSEAQFQLAIDTIPGLVWSAMPDGHIDYLNQRWREYTGLSLQEAGGWGWQVAIHPEDVAGLMEYWKSVLAAGKPGETEARLRRFDGEYRWFLFRGVPLYDELGTLVKWYGQTTDIDDRKRAETLLAGEKRILEMIARGNDRAVILEALCHLLEEMISGSFCSILTLDDASQQLCHVAAPSLPKSYTQAVDGQCVHPALGPCGTAAYRGEQVILSDASAQTSWPEYRELALANRLRACWSTPIFSQERKVLGVFTVHSSAPASPSPYQVNLIEQLRDIASIAMERAQAEEALRRSEAYLSEAQRLSHTGSFYWNPASGQLTWSQETYRIYE